MTSPGELTDGQREEAQRLVYPWASTHIHEMSDEHQATIERVAIALVAEGERARAPFLALAAEYGDRSDSVKDPRWARSLWIFSQRIRRAAEEAS